MPSALSFINLIFVAFISLFPPVNPIGTALMINPVLHELSPAERKTASLRIAIYCFLICTVTTIAGSWIFRLFGISLPVVQVAGGILICKMGWQFLSSEESARDLKEHHELASNHQDIDDKLFYPLAFPMTTGAGTISVLLTLSAEGNDDNVYVHMVNLLSLITAVAFMCVLVYLSDAYTPALIRRLGNRGELVVNRLSAFLVFCVGIQILVAGITHLVKQ